MVLGATVWRHLEIVIGDVRKLNLIGSASCKGGVKECLQVSGFDERIDRGFTQCEQKLVCKEVHELIFEL